MRRCLLLGPAMLLIGCGSRVEQYVLPDQVSDFNTLYASNCAGCHGRDGRYGAARSLNDPVFLAVIGKENLRDVIAKGVPGTGMPAFALNAGGGLTDPQIAILANEIEARWSNTRNLEIAALPPYSAELGDAKAGEAVFQKGCAGCHGEGGIGGPKAGSVVDPAFLTLVSDQSLRLTVIAGRFDQNTPDRRACSPSHPITQQEISDVVAWLASHRVGAVNVTQRGPIEQ